MTSELNKEIYGVLPNRPLHLSVKPLTENSAFMASKATITELEMELDFGDKTAKMPFISAIPKSALPCPAIIIIGSMEDFNRYADEWISKGYAIFFVNYKDVSENNSDFKSGISAFISPSRRKKSSAGKIAVWAWAALRVLEYAEVLDIIDKRKIGIAGRGIFAHSAMLNSDKFSFIIAEELPEINKIFLEENPHLFARGY